MRRLLLLLCCGCCAGTDVGQLRKLYDADRMFELRRALREDAGADNQTLFYRAAVEARFGHEAAGIDALHQFLGTHPDSQLERRANEELAGAFERLGQWGEAAQAWSEAVRLTSAKDPDRADNVNTGHLDEILREVPAQTTHIDEDATVQARRNGIGGWNVPLEVNGQTGEWIFDTGANISTIAESEARRMGLEIKDARAYVRGSTAKRSSIRLAIANDVRFGSARLSNVVFLVLDDSRLYIAPIKYQIEGILGLPVIRELGSFTMSAEGAIKIGTQERAEESEPNLFFDELTPMVEARHNGQDLQLFLDSGNNATFLYPSFRHALTAEESAHLKKKRDQQGGVGGTVERTSEVIPTLRFEILGRDIELKAVSLLRKQPAGGAGRRDGVFGADLLAKGFTLDFQSMQFRIQ